MMSVVAHSTADGSARMLLNAFEEVRKRNGNHDTTHTISHCFVIDYADYNPFWELNIVAEVHTGVGLYRSSVAADIIETLGERVAPNWVPVEKLVEAGAVVVSGSEYTIGANPRPLEHVESMVTRRKPTDSISVIPEVYDRPMNTGISLEQAIRVVTINAAYSMGKATERGSIQQGKSADFVVRGKNLFEIEPQDISGTAVLKTVFEGNVVFDASKEEPFRDQLWLDWGRLDAGGCFC